MLSLLSRRGVRATFTAAAVALERAPGLARAIADGVRGPCAHGCRSGHHVELGEDSKRDFVPQGD